MAASLRSTRSVAKAVLPNRMGRIDYRLSEPILTVKVSTEKLALYSGTAVACGFTPRSVRGVAAGDCGRDTHYWAPPAQNRTGSFPAYGSHLGCLTAGLGLPYALRRR